ncbi:hypothetical protein [Streptomyces sp. NPDC046939]|uniref:hypothetical protein n=1 Tax=Streptomyces sp. NPDC046939 TaxID=3155376 RepID=UPI0033C4B0BF
MRTAADIAISRALRRTARATAEGQARREPVLVADVALVAWEHFGIETSGDEAAAVLRQRFALRGCATELATDAFENDPGGR